MTDTRTEEMENTGRSTPRQRAIDAYGSTRERVSGAGRRAGDALEEAPLVALAAGLAAGAAIAALLPRTRTENRLLKPVTNRAREDDIARLLLCGEGSHELQLSHASQGS